MSYLLIEPRGTKLRFFCGNCDEDVCEELTIDDLGVDGPPECWNCNDTLSLEWIMFPPSEEHQDNQI